MNETKKPTTVITLRACCLCRREIVGQGEQCTAFGPSFPPAEGESTGFCFACFSAAYGDEVRS